METSESALESWDLVLFRKKKKIGQHLVNSCWPINWFVVLETLFLTYFHSISVHYGLVNTCWPSVDQNYFFEKYASWAFKCRVDHNFSMSGYENSTWWSYNIFGHFRCIFGIFHQITKMTKNVRKCCNFIRLNILDQKSKNYHRHVIWKPWIPGVV